MLGAEISSSIKRELADIINGSASHNDTEAFSHPTGNSSHENEIRDTNNENNVTRHNRLLASMEIFSTEMNVRRSQETESLMSILHCHSSEVLSSASRDRVILEIQRTTGR